MAAINAGDPAAMRTLPGIPASVRIKINDSHKLAIKSAKDAIKHARAAGDALLDARRGCDHGQWLPWLKKNCPSLPERTASHYMRLAERWPQIEELAKSKSATVADLTVGGAVRYLRDLDDSHRLEETKKHSNDEGVPATSDLKPVKAAASKGARAVLKKEPARLFRRQDEAAKSNAIDAEIIEQPETSKPGERGRVLIPQLERTIDAVDSLCLLTHTSAKETARKLRDPALFLLHVKSARDVLDIMIAELEREEGVA